MVRSDAMKNLRTKVIFSVHRVRRAAVCAGLAVLLISILALAGHSPVRERADQGALQLNGLPSTNKFYWAAMLAAGTLGTAAGDFVGAD